MAQHPASWNSYLVYFAIYLFIFGCFKWEGKFGSCYSIWLQVKISKLVFFMYLMSLLFSEKKLYFNHLWVSQFLNMLAVYKFVEIWSGMEGVGAIGNTRDLKFLSFHEAFSFALQEVVALFLYCSEPPGSFWKQFRVLPMCHSKCMEDVNKMFMVFMF